MQLFPQYMSQTKLTGGPLPTRKHKTPLTKPSGEPYSIVQDTKRTKLGQHRVVISMKQNYIWTIQIS